jgi:hypothetical protein
VLIDVLQAEQPPAERRRRQTGDHVHVRGARKGPDHLFRQDLAEHALVRSLLASRERYDGYRGQQRAGSGHGRDDRAWARRPDAVSTDRLLDVLYVAFAEVLDLRVQRGSELVTSLRRNDDLARACQGRQPRGQVDAPAVNIATIDKYGADRDPHAQQHLPIRRQPHVAAAALQLDCEGGRCRRPGIWEVQQHPIAEALDQFTPEFGKHAGFDVPNQAQPTLQHANLVLLDEAYRLDHVNDENCADAALQGAVRIGRA